MSTSETLMVIFIAVTAVAVVIQMGVLLALFVTVKKSSVRMEALAGQLEARALPALDAAQVMLQEYRPKLNLLIANVTETSTTVKEQVARLDDALGDVSDRVRLQVARMDQLLGHTLDRVENATELMHHSLVGPVRQASGVLQGITAGVATLLNKGPYARAKRPTGTPKDDWFI